MSKWQDLFLRALSHIDEDFIDEATDCRIALMKKVQDVSRRRRKTFMVAGSIAASFLLVFSMVLSAIFILPDSGSPLPPDTGDSLTSDSGDPPVSSDPETTPAAQGIPVYRGMTVSGEVIQSEPTLSRARLSLLGNAYGHNKGELGTLDEALVPDGLNRAVYYTRPNEDIYITIHLDNPKQYEILSFTLNGLKYQSYMFEDESTSEQLILKVNVGDVEGVVEYTIDAIKYVDGEKIKDVRMEGDKTVKIGVYPEDQPAPTFTNVVADSTSMTFDVEITDTLNLIRESSGAVYAAIVEEFGTEILALQKIELGQTNTVTFDGLTTGKAYRRLILADYDSLDGQGYTRHIIDDQIVSTAAPVEFDSFVFADTKDAVTFELKILDGYSVNIEKIELISDDNTVIKSGDASVREFSRVNAGRYKVVVTYTFDPGDGQGARQGFTESEYSDWELNFLSVVDDGVLRHKEGDPDAYMHNDCFDIMPTGDSYLVYAICDGIVIWHSFGNVANGPFGVCIQSPGIESCEYLITYSLLDQLFVEDGQTVKCGDVIGTVSKAYPNDARLYGCQTIDEGLSSPFVHIQVWMPDNPVSTYDPFVREEDQP